MTSELQIHTTAYVIAQKGVQVKVSEQDYRSFKEGRLGFEDLVKINETSVHSTHHGNGRVTAEVESSSLNGMHLTSVQAQALSVGEGSASVSVARGRDNVTNEAVNHAQEWGRDNHPSFGRRLVHILSTMVGSSDSRNYLGEDAKHVPLPRNVQATLSKTRQIDEGRSRSYDELKHQIKSARPSVHFTPDSHYSGNDTRQMLLSKSPAQNPNIHISGSFFGTQTEITSLDGTPAKEIHLAHQIMDKTDISYREALLIVQNNHSPSSSGDTQNGSGTVEYRIGKHIVSEEEYDSYRSGRR